MRIFYGFHAASKSGDKVGRATCMPLTTAACLDSDSVTSCVMDVRLRLAVNRAVSQDTSAICMAVMRVGVLLGRKGALPG